MSHGVNWYLTFKSQKSRSIRIKDILCDDVILNHADPVVLYNENVRWGIRLKNRVWKSTLRILLKDYPEIEMCLSKPKRKKRSPPKSKTVKVFNLEEYVQKMDNGISLTDLYVSAKAKVDKKEFTWLCLHERELIQAEKCIHKYAINNPSSPSKYILLYRSRSSSREKENIKTKRHS